MNFIAWLGIFKIMELVYLKQPPPCPSGLGAFLLPPPLPFQSLLKAEGI